MLLQLKNTTGIFFHEPPPCEWHQVLLSWSKAEYDQFESGDFITGKGAKACVIGISPSIMDG